MSKNERKDKIDEINKVEKEFRENNKFFRRSFKVNKTQNLIELEV